MYSIKKPISKARKESCKDLTKISIENPNLFWISRKLNSALN